mgnify:CR=1 FL=1
MPFITPRKIIFYYFITYLFLFKNIHMTFLKLLQFEISRQGHECQLEYIEFPNINMPNEYVCLWMKMYIYVIKLGTYLKTLPSPCNDTLYKNWKIPNEQLLLWINQGLAMLKQFHTQYNHFSFNLCFISNSYIEPPPHRPNLSLPV